MTTFDSGFTFDSSIPYDLTSVQSTSSVGPPPGVPHFQIPFTIGPVGTVLTVQQGTTAEIVQSVSNLIGTTPGTRYMVPAYGIPDPTFEGIDPVTLRLAVAKYEPRATVTVKATPGNTSPFLVSVSTR